MAPARRILIVDDETYLRIPPSDIPSEDGALRPGTRSSPKPRRNRLTANRSSCDVPELVQRSPFEGVLIATRLARHAG